MTSRFGRRPRRRLGPTFVQRSAFSVAALSLGCASTIEIDPTLPSQSQGVISRTPVGVYMPPGVLNEPYDIPLGSGIWPGTTYTFVPGEDLGRSLPELAKRYFPRAGIAESSLDKKWNYVLEYVPQRPMVEGSTLASNAAVDLAMRDTRSAREIESGLVQGVAEARPGKMTRFFLGRLSEERALEESLSSAYTDLYRKMDAALARAAAKEVGPGPERPYGRR